MPRTPFKLAVLTTLILGLGVGGFSPAAADETDDELHVPLTFVPAIIGSLPNHLGGDAPGSNDWDCVPTAEKPRPVVLVHGTIGNQSTNWQTFSPALANEGYCVFALTYGLNDFDPGVAGGTGTPIEDSAEELRIFIDEVLAATGADAVDIVGHSQGSLMPNYYVKFLGGAAVVENYVGITPLWDGTQFAAGFASAGSLPLCPACSQMAQGSDFLAELSEGGLAVDGVNYLNLMTQYDQIVLPYTSGFAEGMENVVIQDVCPADYSDHLSVVSSPTALDLTLRHLDPADDRAVRCAVTLPVLGVAGLGLVTDPLQGLVGSLLQQQARSLADDVEALAATE